MIFEYRAWDKKIKVMAIVSAINYSKIQEGIASVTLGDFSIPDRRVAPEDIILMAHIGLTDNSGKKIYENDIVELRYKLYPKRAPIVCVVWWLEYKACFRAVKSKNFIANMGNTDKYVTKVIGNTLATPELWKDTEGITMYYGMNKKQLHFTSRLAKKK